jgi:tRNA(Met) C34 N-acetyltransferase TmcA
MEDQFYMNNPNLPKRGAKFEYTPEQIADLKKASKDIIYFAENFFYIIAPGEGRNKIKLHKCQKKALKMLEKERFSIICASRQIGKSTIMTIFALWVACFNSDQRILLVANKESTAIEIFRRVRLAYEELPNWLKPPVKEYGKTSAEFENGSRIGITTTTSSAGRGSSCDLLILDELAHVECVGGDTLIEIRNTKTGEIKNIPILEAYKMFQND